MDKRRESPVVYDLTVHNDSVKPLTRKACPVYVDIASNRFTSRQMIKETIGPVERKGLLAIATHVCPIY